MDDINYIAACYLFFYGIEIGLHSFGPSVKERTEINYQLCRYLEKWISLLVCCVMMCKRKGKSTKYFTFVAMA